MAYYLPQFYPIPENDAWYGAGFTEWRNVAQARPFFQDHYQPRIPADLGFYDLRVREVREQQARLATQHGIDAFCYYHYWFHGTRPLSRVIDDVLDNGAPDIPFCLAWANENWSRHWDASQHEVLLKQTYSAEDEVEHGRFLLRAMSHPRYLRLAGKPLLFIYRVQTIPDPKGTIDRWRQYWRSAGLGEVRIVKFDTHGDFNDPAGYGADTAAQFLPHGLNPTVPRIKKSGCSPNNFIYSYEQTMETYLAAPQPEWTRHECVIPSWDNTARRGDGKSLVVHGSTPDLYERWLRAVHERTPDDGLVLINAWNEWAEGAYLEPDLKYGRGYLEATARAVGVPVPEPDSWRERMYPPAEIDEGAVDEDKRLADLYLDAVEQLTTLRRQLSRLEGTFERQIEFAVREAKAEAKAAQTYALRLAVELERVRRGKAG
ncbi:MAG: glycoside hydrolase family 99-like domain-containing protein [Sporichthya sp.]|nr:glycoside hydrolase family 99-like domain-containing protein [Sporichthya sp.]